MNDTARIETLIEMIEQDKHVLFAVVEEYEARLASASQRIEALEQALAQRPELRVPCGFGTRLGRWLRRVFRNPA